MSHNKFNGRFEFPKSVNMKEYTVEHIERQSVLREIEEKNIAIDELEDSKKEILESNFPDDYYEYELTGIVVHMGEANSGHYISYIKDRESDDPNAWYEFNDDLVIPFDIEELDEKTFGGETEIYFTDENGEQEHAKTEKTANAYMLVYERKQLYLWETINSNKEELIRIDQLGKLKEKVNTKQISQEENKEPEKAKQEISVFEDLIDIDDSEQSKSSSGYDLKIPEEFSHLIQTINMREWQLKYIF